MTAFHSGLSGIEVPVVVLVRLDDQGRAGSSREALGDLEGHHVVEGSVRQQRRDAHRQPLDRRRDARRLAVEETVHDPVREPQLAGALQVEHAGLRHDPRQWHARVLARGGPRGQVTACGMTDRHHPRQVHAIELGELVDGRAHVVERLRHAAAVAQPAVLDVPRRPAALGKVLGQRLVQVEAVLGLPEPAVDDDRHRALAIEHAELRGVVAVAMDGLPHRQMLGHAPLRRMACFGDATGPGRSGVQGPARLHAARASVLRPVRAAVLGGLGVALPARAAARELPLAHPPQPPRRGAGDRLLPRARRAAGGQRGHDPRPEPQRPAPRRGAPGGAGRHGGRSRRAQAAPRQGSVRVRRA